MDQNEKAVPQRLTQPTMQLKETLAPKRTHEDPIPKPTKRRKLLSFEDEGEQFEEIRITKNVIKQTQRKKSIEKPKNSQEKHQENIEEHLKEQYYKQVDKLKEELIEFQFSYWEGANVVKKIRRKKKENIKKVIQVCRLELIENFQNLATVDPDELLCVIKDFIAPHELSLYDVELLQLKTLKHDPLFNLKDVIVKKDGKEIRMSVNVDGPFRIIERSKYEKNKHLFPFNNWHTLELDKK